MQVFRPSSALSVVAGQPAENTEWRGWSFSLVRRDWLSVLSLMGTISHRKIYRESYTFQAPLGPAIDLY